MKGVKAMNKAILCGRLTADPELRQTQGGVSCCRFTVAVNRKYNKDAHPQADFISCTAWRQTAEFVSKWFSKGQPILVEGSLRTGSYTDKNHSDVTHYTTDVLVDSVEFAGKKEQAQQSEQPAPQQPTGSDLSYGNGEFEEILCDSELPF